MASLIKTALCLNHRFIPGVPQWESPKAELHPEIFFMFQKIQDHGLFSPEIKKVRWNQRNRTGPDLLKCYSF
ncbi:MAG: hypothetical protein CM1200mP30_12970 [Pseudomonadota bacterium]|nr:MAG: hypothetical protein CM1200mP30_12970 [Pseudomonadota bacterium]